MHRFALIGNLAHLPYVRAGVPGSKTGRKGGDRGERSSEKGKKVKYDVRCDR